ncbi:hypothetical protein PS3A_28530 [Pseudomonas sp. 3A(2025)]
MQLFKNQPRCDLYSTEVITSPTLRFLKLYDDTVDYLQVLNRSGYCGVSIERINMLRLIVDLRRDGFNASSIPVCYKSASLLTRQACFALAENYASSQGFSILADVFQKLEIPIYHTFSIIQRSEEKAGGIVRVDRLDGHIWTMLEFEEYMHDYNGVLL